ncbi:hypothetical protein PC113_g25336 [Phytophthora cactorum]|uniref:Integrase catalytic domain-containing protein n=1 Tax=Phytophthora cactorum TaxID=29920 RepID=A0A8T0XYQ6_9STRA|nr:hypothetical protein PC113_g25336 [Phytophthora cactorum]
MDFVFGLPPGSKRRTGVVVFVDRFSKMVHLAAVPAEVTAVQIARLFVDMVFKHHGMPLDIVSDRDPRFTARFWQDVFTILGTQLSMPTADHPQADGQTERVNLVLGDLFKSYAHSYQRWSDCLPMGSVCHQHLGEYNAASTPSDYAWNGGFLLKWSRGRGAQCNISAHTPPPTPSTHHDSPDPPTP